MEDFRQQYSDPNLPPPPKFEWKYLIYTFLIISQVATWGLIIFDKNRTRETFQVQEKKIYTLDSAKKVLQKMYDASLALLNEKAKENARLDSMIQDKDNEIARLKERISLIINKKSLT